MRMRERPSSGMRESCSRLEGSPASRSDEREHVGAVSTRPAGAARRSVPGARPFLDRTAEPFRLSGPLHRGGIYCRWRYESRIDINPAAIRPGAARLRDRLASCGVTTAPLCMERYEEELKEIFALSSAAFAANLYYRPINFITFRSMSEGMRPWIDPELVRLARNGEGRLLGFLFAFPDPLSLEHGRPTRTVAKTGAVAPDAHHWGSACTCSTRFERWPIGKAAGR